MVRDLEAFGLLVAIAVASALLLLPRGDDGLIGFPSLKPGEVAPRTVKSSRAFSAVDPVLTAQTRERARASVRPVFDHLLGLAQGSKARIKAAFDSLNRSLSPTGQAGALTEALGIDVEPTALVPLLSSGRGGEIIGGASMLLDALFSRQLVSDPTGMASGPPITLRSVDADGRVTSEAEADPRTLEVLGPNQARALVDTLAAERLSDLPLRTRRAVARVVKELLTPNLIPNAQETLRRRRIAWLSVKPAAVLVARGERLVREGERVSERDLLLLKRLAKLESPRARLQSVFGSALLGVLLAWLAYLSARYAYRHCLPRKHDLVFLATSFVAFLLLVWLGYKVVEWLAEIRPLEGLPAEGYRLVLPVATVAIVVRLSAGPVAAAAAAPVFGLLAGWMMDGDLGFATFALAGACAAASTEPGAKRIVLSAGARAGLAQALVVVGTALLASDFRLEGVAMKSTAALLSGLSAALLARGVLPAVEALFGYTTPTGLTAFANAEHPLLRELLIEVPGTYHHSLHVGGLAEAGARAIGSDRLLARVGGYLHDVGRLGGPRDPAERRKVAAQLAIEHRFPPELAQILAEQPHEAALGGALQGSRFGQHQPAGVPEASSLDEAPPTVRPRPKSKTSALIFLADRVEDALQGREGEFAGRPELAETIREQVRTAVSDQLLDDADLELRELAAVGAAFTEALEVRFVRSVSKAQNVFRMPPPTGAPS